MAGMLWVTALSTACLLQQGLVELQHDLEKGRAVVSVGCTIDQP
jgi:hypothetical protein